MRQERMDSEIARSYQTGTNPCRPGSQHLRLRSTPQCEKLPNTQVIDIDAMVSSSESSDDSTSEAEVEGVVLSDGSGGAAEVEATAVSNKIEGEDLLGVDIRWGVYALTDCSRFRLNCNEFPARDGMRQLYCDKCFCFACEELVSKFRKWHSHQCATVEKAKWVLMPVAVLKRRKSTPG